MSLSALVSEIFKETRWAGHFSPPPQRGASKGIWTKKYIDKKMLDEKMDGRKKVG